MCSSAADGEEEEAEEEEEEGALSQTDEWDQGRKTHNCMIVLILRNIMSCDETKT